MFTDIQAKKRGNETATIESFVTHPGLNSRHAVVCLYHSLFRITLSALVSVNISNSGLCLIHVTSNSPLQDEDTEDPGQPQ